MTKPFVSSLVGSLVESLAAPLTGSSAEPAAPVITGVPTISGTEQEGETLTASPASVTGVPTPTRTWQWQRSSDGTTGWANISGATSSTYTLVTADVTNYVRVVQTETNSEDSDTANSAASGQIASSAYTTTANDYDRTNDYGTLASPTGAADVSELIISAWVRIDGGDGTNRRVLDIAGGNRYPIQFNTLNQLKIQFNNTSAALVINLGSGTYTAGATWLHILISANTTSATTTNNYCRVYVNDVAYASDLDIPNVALDIKTADWAIGAEDSGANKFGGCLSELYVNLGESLDLTVESNRRKFIDASGKPVDLGSDGSTPTGTQPILYAPDGDPSTNAGSGGNFTITGALAACSSSPSD